MFWPDTGTGVDVEPARKPVAAAVRKFFTEGGVGVPPTVAGGDWFNQITNELINVLAAAGIDPSKADDDQLLEAIKRVSNSTSAREALRRSYAEAGYTLVDGGFEVGGRVTSANDVLLYEFNGRAYSYSGILPYDVEGVSSPGLEPGMWVDRSPENIRSKLNENTGAGVIRTTSSKTVQQEIDSIRWYFGSTVNIADYESLKEAISALSVFGGTVIVPVGKFFSGDWTYDNDYMSKDNVSIVGHKMPTWNSDASALVGGSIIEGRFNAFAHNFSVENVGFDMGKNVIDARYEGASTLDVNHPLGGTWDAFAFAQPNMASPQAQRKNFMANNVIALCKESMTVGHAFLAEGFDGGFMDNIIGIYSIHATVIKAQNVRVGSIAGFMASGEGLIIKSDSYAPGGDIQIASVLCDRNLPNCTPHSAPTIPYYGLFLNPASQNFTGPIQIGSVVAKGSDNGFAASGLVGVDIQIGSVITDGLTGTMRYAVNIGGIGQFRRINIGQLICNNVVDALLYKHPNAAIDDPHLHIGSMQVTNASGIAVAAYDYAKVIIDSLDLKSVAMAYNFASGNAKILIGNAALELVTYIFQSEIGLAANWINYGNSTSSFKADLHGYGVRIMGLVKAEAGAAGVISSLIPSLRPKNALRFIAYKNNGTLTTALIGIDPALGIVLDDGASPATGNYVSLDGITWPL
jgi:hypothetical protein